MPFRPNKNLIHIFIAFSALLLLTNCGNESIELDGNSLPEIEEPGDNNQKSVEPVPEEPLPPDNDESDDEDDKGDEEQDEKTPNPFKNEQASRSTSFLTLPDGRKLSDIKVKDRPLSLAKGRGRSFSSSDKRDYEKLKRETQTEVGHKVQWTFMNLDTGRVIERSLSADRKIFGASSSKIYVGAALLDRQNGRLSRSQTQKMADMLVVSSNSAWTSMQREIGSGSSDKGRERIHRFTQRMGYEKTRGFQGYWGDIHGNELTPDESAQTLYDIYQNNFKGAETLWKIMYTCRTGINRGRNYLPKNLYVGGKTGSYSGPTENPQTGETYNVRMKNHLLVFAVDGVQYGLAVLANSGVDKSAALLAGGLIREHTSIR